MRIANRLNEVEKRGSGANDALDPSLASELITIPTILF
jgi:hypothetical protein